MHKGQGKYGEVDDNFVSPISTFDDITGYRSLLWDSVSYTFDKFCCCCLF